MPLLFFYFEDRNATAKQATAKHATAKHATAKLFLDLK